MKLHPVSSLGLSRLGSPQPSRGPDGPTYSGTTPMHVPGAPERTGRRLSPRGPEEQSARVGGSLSAPCCFGDGAERGRPDRPISHDACITTRCRTKHSRRWSGDWSLGYESWRGRQMACGWTAGLAAHLDRFLPPSPAQGVFRVCGTTSHERGRLAEARASGPETPTGLHVRHRGPTLDIASAIKERAAQRPELSELVRNVTPLAGLADSLFPDPRLLLALQTTPSESADSGAWEPGAAWGVG